MGIPKEDLQSIASILAAGYLRHRDQLRRKVPRLDCSETSSRHGHEANGYENGERNGDRDAEEIDELSRMTVGQLRQKYIEAFGEESRSNHKQFLFRRIAWRIQALAEGGLSQRARRRALEIANDADLRIRAPKTKFGEDVALDPRLSVTRKVAGALDPRLPPPGTDLEREYKGRRIIAKLLEDGFEFDGEIYRSLSAIAQEATGTKWNGFLFFNLTAEENLNGKA